MDVGVLESLEEALQAQCAALDPDSVPLPDAPALFARLASIERLAAGAKLRVARRVDDAGTAGLSGDRSTAEWVARQTGTSIGAARDVVETSKRLAALGDTDAAVAQGRLSEPQARAIADAAAVDPDAEQALLATAAHAGLRDLKDRCATTKANAHPNPQARRDAIHRARYLRTFRDPEGAWNLQVRHLPEVGAEIEALLAPFTHARFEAARRAGDHEAHEAYRADGLLDLARASRTGSVPTGASRAETKVVVHIDVETLLSGRTRPGSRCDIDGIGPVDVDWVRHVYGEAFATAVVEDTIGVRAVIHLGRQVTAHQRTALEARGYQCEVPGCGIGHNLEIEHRDDFALSRRTTLDDLWWACPHHHRQKTHHGYRLTGPHGARAWTAPDGTSRHDPPRAQGPPADADLYTGTSA